jgi:hypothetical protein
MKKSFILVLLYAVCAQSFAQENELPESKDTIPYLGIGTEFIRHSIYSAEVRLAWRGGPYVAISMLGTYKLSNDPERPPVNLLNFVAIVGYGLKKDLPGILRYLEGSGAGGLYGAVTSSENLGLPYQVGYYFNVSTPILKLKDYTILLNARHMESWIFHTKNQRGLTWGITDKHYSYNHAGCIIQF